MNLAGYATIRSQGYEPLDASETTLWRDGLEYELLPVEFKLVIDLSNMYIKYRDKYDENETAQNPYDPENDYIDLD